MEGEWVLAPSVLANSPLELLLAASTTVPHLTLDRPMRSVGSKGASQETAAEFEVMAHKRVKKDGTLHANLNVRPGALDIFRAIGNGAIFSHVSSIHTEFIAVLPFLNCSGTQLDFSVTVEPAGLYRLSAYDSTALAPKALVQNAVARLAGYTAAALPAAVGICECKLSHLHLIV